MNILEFMTTSPVLTIFILIVVACCIENLAKIIRGKK